MPAKQASSQLLANLATRSLVTQHKVAYETISEGVMYHPYFFSLLHPIFCIWAFLILVDSAVFVTGNQLLMCM